MYDYRSHLLIGILTAAFVSPISMVSAEEPPAPPPPRANKIRVLVMTGGHNFQHEEFFDVFTGYPDITYKEVTHPEAVKWYSPEKAGEYDVMVWYDFVLEGPSEEDRKNLLTLLGKGKPLVVLHHSLINYQDWPECEKIMGGKYLREAEGDQPASTCQNNVKFTIKIADPKHPITRFMKDFDIIDEVYAQFRVSPDVKPILTVDHPKSGKVIGWTHTYGHSPVAYIQSGHGPTAYKNPNYRRLMVQIIRWAAGRLPDPSDEGFVPLFNGKNLDGWTVMGKPEGFKVVDGILRSDIGHVGYWLRSNTKYSDFIYRVEWRISQNGNSGVFVRAAEEGHPWVTGSEIQISNFPRDLAHCTGSLYGSVAVDPRPDESAEIWHEFEIHCRGPFYKIFADNIPIIDVDARQVPALNERPLTGYIGLQDCHAEKGYVEYRNIRIKELPPVNAGQPDWRLGIQTYSFREFTFFEAIEKAKTLGVKNLEGYTWQRISPDLPAKVQLDWKAPEDVLQQVKQKLDGAGIKLANLYVRTFSNDEADARKIFDFAKKMGVETIVSEPKIDAFNLLDKLTAEYGINLAIHNHVKNHKAKPDYVYWNPDEVLKLIKGCNPRIGACPDTGHWLRSGLDPVEGLKKLKGRIITVHLKDLKEKGVPQANDVPWGTGIGEVKGVLTELHDQGFNGLISIEYENNPKNNMPEITQCIKYFNNVSRQLSASK